MKAQPSTACKLFGFVLAALLLAFFPAEAGRTADQASPEAEIAAILASAVSVAAGSSHTCAVTAEGGVKCWGWNSDGQLGDGTTMTRPAPGDVMGLPAGSGATAVVAASWHTCAIVNGGAKCWGGNDYGQLGDQTDMMRLTPVDVYGLAAGSGVTALTAYGGHTCAIVNGGMKCWGDNDLGQLGDGTTTSHRAPVDVVGLPAGSGVSAAATSFGHTCALVNGGVKCWGYNGAGQLGDGTTAPHLTAADVSGLAAGSGAVAVTAGGSFSCAVVNGGLKCWGDNFYGQLGDGTTENRRAPVDVAGLVAGSGVSAAAAGGWHTCAVVAGGAKCWGWNTFGQLGDGTIVDHLTPADVTGLGVGSGASTIAAGAGHNCAVVSGGLTCWGRNSTGQLGDGETTNRLTPLDVTGLPAGSGVSAASAGFGHTCGLAGGGVKCWGWNGRGQLGDGGTRDRWTPADVAGLAPGDGAGAVSANIYHSCAVVEGGVKCWGQNDTGQLGDGTATDRQAPVDVLGLGAGSDVTGVAAGNRHSCAVVNGGVKCWGDNASGQLGDGTRTERRMPVDVIGLPAGSGATGVWAGLQHTCAVVSGGLKCWGGNSYGQLGDGTTADRLTPGDVAGLAAGSGVAEASAGLTHTCALVGGGMKCWGQNEDGRLGDGTTTDRRTPVDVVGLAAGSGVTGIGAGGQHSCAIVGGGVKCWGANDAGQLGDGTVAARLQPVDVAGLPAGSEVVAVAASQAIISGNVGHTCAVAAGGVKCWGSNRYGELGVNPGWTPVMVIGFAGEPPLRTYLPLIWR